MAESNVPNHPASRGEEQVTVAAALSFEADFMEKVVRGMCEIDPTRKVTDAEMWVLALAAARKLLTECADCGFRYSAEHENDEGGFSCPVCAEHGMADALGVIAGGSANPSVVAAVALDQWGDPAWRALLKEGER